MARRPKIPTPVVSSVGGSSPILLPWLQSVSDRDVAPGRRARWRHLGQQARPSGHPWDSSRSMRAIPILGRSTLRKWAGFSVTTASRVGNTCPSRR
jgi:hypothetical protein